MKKRYVSLYLKKVEDTNLHFSNKVECFNPKDNKVDEWHKDDNKILVNTLLYVAGGDFSIGSGSTSDMLR